MADLHTGWVPLVGRPVGDLESWSMAWTWDRVYHQTPRAAADSGCRMADDTDDFNLGHVVDGVLIWFGWMDEKHPEEDYPEIAAHFGWSTTAASSVDGGQANG